jgi:biotin synthase
MDTEQASRKVSKRTSSPGCDGGPSGGASVFSYGDTTKELDLAADDKLTADTAQLVAKALNGDKLDRNDLLHLCGIHPHSADYYHLKWATRHMNYHAAEGVAEVHAQIGVDANPCSKNCRWCSFAAASDIRKRGFELSLDEIVKHARTFETDGANCLTVMSTADFDFDKYLSILAAIRESVSPNMPIMANIGDFDYLQALKLKAAGVGSVYHAIRMGEGVVTQCSLQTRLDSIEAAKNAGLKLSTCLEMIGPHCPAEQVVDMIQLSISLKPQNGGIGSWVSVPGTPGENDERFPRGRLKVYSCVYRLAAGWGMRFGGATLSWAEAGCNPRDVLEHTDSDEGRGSSVAEIREFFEDGGWTVLRTPSKYW